MSSTAQAYRHSWSYNPDHFFYYHKDCVDRNPPRQEGMPEVVTFDLIALQDVPQGAECDGCYQPVHAMSVYQVRETIERAYKAIKGE